MLLCLFQRGNVYIADYSVLHGMNSMNQDTEHNNHTAAPMCLFLVQKSGNMKPIAIQLSQEVGSAIWTPVDGSEDWLLAKLFVRHADFLHQFVAHMLYCHLAMEPFVLATMRQLPQAHPVYKLLKPHFRLLFSFQIPCVHSRTLVYRPKKRSNEFVDPFLVTSARSSIYFFFKFNDNLLQVFLSR